MDEPVTSSSLLSATVHEVFWSLAPLGCCLCPDFDRKRGFFLNQSLFQKSSNPNREKCADGTILVERRGEKDTKGVFLIGYKVKLNFIFEILCPAFKYARMPFRLKK